MAAMRRALPLALLLCACQAPPAPAPSPGPTPGAIRFSTAAIGPVPIAGGAVVVDPGPLCPATGLRVVGAGLPPGEVRLLTEPGAADPDPIAVRADGSFDRTLPVPSLAPGSPMSVNVFHGASFATVPFTTCTPASPVPGLVLGGAGVVQ